MKKTASALVTLVIVLVVLLGAFGVGLGVKQIRKHRARSRPGPVAEKSQPTQDPRAALPGGGARPRIEAPTPEQRARLQDQRARELERVQNMSQDQRQRYLEERRRSFDAGQRGSGGRRRPGGMGLSDEERQRMRERFESMTEQEREQFRQQMRERFGSGRRGGGGPGGRPGFGPGAVRRPPDQNEPAAPEAPRQGPEE